MGWMFWTYTIVGLILFAVWFIFLCTAVWLRVDGEVDTKDFKEMSACLAAAFLGIVIWPAIIPLAFIGFLLFGITMGLKFLVKGSVV